MNKILLLLVSVVLLSGLTVSSVVAKEQTHSLTSSGTYNEDNHSTDVLEKPEDELDSEYKMEHDTTHIEDELEETTESGDSGNSEDESPDLDVLSEEEHDLVENQEYRNINRDGHEQVSQYTHFSN